MVTNSKLTLECLAIGSLPHINLENAMELVKKDFKNIPFWEWDYIKIDFFDKISHLGTKNRHRKIAIC